MGEGQLLEELLARKGSGWQSPASSCECAGEGGLCPIHSLHTGAICLPVDFGLGVGADQVHPAGRVLGSQLSQPTLDTAPPLSGVCSQLKVGPRQGVPLFSHSPAKSPFCECTCRYLGEWLSPLGAFPLLGGTPPTDLPSWHPPALPPEAQGPGIRPFRTLLAVPSTPPRVGQCIRGARPESQPNPPPPRAVEAEVRDSSPTGLGPGLVGSGQSESRSAGSLYRWGN